MPTEDEYSEDEQSGSDEEEEVKSGDISDDDDQADSDQGSDDDEYAPKKKTQEDSKALSKAVKKDEVSLPESIATEVSIKGADKEFVFDRTIKKRLKPVPRVFDVEYRLTQPAEHPDSTANGCKVLRSVTHVKEFLLANDLTADGLVQFDFSQRYGDNGELTEYGRKQESSAGVKGSTYGGTGKRKNMGSHVHNAKKQKVGGGATSNHPLSKCVQILFDVMSTKEAALFNKPVQAKHAPGYFDKIKRPLDLGTIFSNLKDGIYPTAHQVRKDVTLVWKNCLTYNGADSDITHIAEVLAMQFDEMFEEAITAPQHLGMASFKQGPEWINKKVECYWDEDKEWYAGSIVEYDPDKTNDQGLTTPYRIKYNEDDEDEWMDLPGKDVAIVESWEGMADELGPWEGFTPPLKGGTASGRTQRARTTTKHFTPIPGPTAGGNSRRGKRVRPSGTDAFDDAFDDDLMPGEMGARSEADLARVDGEKISSDFICDDGLPCGEVCRCRLLFWCRFKARKGMTLAPKGSSKSMVNKVERCCYANCPHPTISSNDRWHFISQHTNSGRFDWSELMGQTLCSSCFQQYRGKGTLLRARDSQVSVYP
mmetsp:Transcript_34347/g.55457  ORF Transcript_34347/g.55457 Transcript_34347/m.55457 type:complete len:594 (-) Transcript_34347:76-1857(-)